MYNNSDGYILIDMKDVNMTLSTQHINGIFNRIVEVIDTNKLAVVINAGDNTPMAAIVHKKFNYYVINTTLYIFTINSNDIVIVEEAGEATVDVEIVPTLMSGTKIADYAIGAVTGELYAPTPTSEINDNVIAENSTWSSDKISTQLSAKANSSDLATVATTGAYADLSGTPTVPTKTSQLENDSGFITSAQVPTIDDSTVSQTSVWSSYKTSAELGNKANSADVYTKTEVDNALADKQNKTDNSLTTTNKTVVGAINELNTGSMFRVGDIITASVYKHCAGRTTNAGDKVLFFYPTAKPISNNCSSASLVVSDRGQCFTSMGAISLKAGTYTGTITDGGIYFLVDLITAYTDGGRVATVELQSRTITFS